MARSSLARNPRTEQTKLKKINTKYQDQSKKSPRTPQKTYSQLPIPKGNSPYAKAKRAEYIHKDLNLAKTYYQQAIESGERTESAVKDLASILHQEGNTSQAIALLKQFQSIFMDQDKLSNLLESLRKQLVPSGNSLFRFLRVSPLLPSDTPDSVLRLFSNTSRVVDVHIHHESFTYALLKFPSHSAARKTWEGFNGAEKYTIEWVSVSGEVRKELVTKEDPYSSFWSLPQYEYGTTEELEDDLTAQKLLGKGLLEALEDTYLSPMAPSFQPSA